MNKRWTAADRSENRERLEKVRGITEVLVSKNGKGPTDTVRLLLRDDDFPKFFVAVGRRIIANV